MSGASRLLREALAARLARREGRALASRPRGSITSDPNGTPLQGLDTTPSVSDPVEMRMARARRLGFDTETPLYHGTTADFAEFNGGANLRDTRGIHLADDPETANFFAGMGQNGRVMPVYVRGRLREHVGPTGSAIEATIRQARAAGDAGVSVTYPGTSRNGFRPRREIIVFDPSNIRSRFAAFDPARSNSSDLLAGLAIGVPAGGLTLREVLRDQYGERA